MVVLDEDTGERNGRSTEIPFHYYFSSFFFWDKKAGMGLLWEKGEERYNISDIFIIPLLISWRLGLRLKP